MTVLYFLASGFRATSFSISKSIKCYSAQQHQEVFCNGQWFLVFQACVHHGEDNKALPILMVGVYIATECQLVLDINYSRPKNSIFCQSKLEWNGLQLKLYCFYLSWYIFTREEAYSHNYAILNFLTHFIKLHACLNIAHYLNDQLPQIWEYCTFFISQFALWILKSQIALLLKLSIEGMPNRENVWHIQDIHKPLK